MNAVTPNRSITPLLTSQLWIHLILINSESFSCNMQSDLHLVSSPWRYERHNVIPFLYQTLVKPVYFILIMLENNFKDEPTTLKF